MLNPSPHPHLEHGRPLEARVDVAAMVHHLLVAMVTRVLAWPCLKCTLKGRTAIARTFHGPPTTLATLHVLVSTIITWEI